MKKIIFLLFFVCIMLFITSNVSVNAYGFGFKRNEEHLTPDIGKYKEILENNNGYYTGNPDQKELYLTFDAGYDNGVLPQILDILRENDVQATFFITGDFINRFSDLTLRLAYDGHCVCNHTYHHYNLTKLSDEKIKQEISLNEEAYYNLTNQRMQPFVRPPEGEFDERSLNVINKLGYKSIFWSIAYMDWIESGQKGIDYTYEMVINNLHNGAIILMHSVSTSNKEALISIINEAKRLGYVFKPISALEDKKRTL